MLQQALTLHQTGRLDEAAALYRQLLAQRPRDAALLNLIGAVEIQRRRPDEAIVFLERAIAIDGNSAAAHCNRGVALQDLSRFQEAVASYDRALAIRHDLHEVWNNRGVVLRELKRFPDALAAYDRAVTILPEYAEAHNNRGNVLRDMLRYDDSLAAYGRALDIRPDYAEARRNRADLLQELQRFGEALSELETQLAFFPADAASHRTRGTVLQNLHRRAEAIQCFEKAIALKPDFQEAHNNLGNVLAEIGRLDEAAMAYERSLSLNSEFLEAQINLGHVRMVQGRASEAVACFRIAAGIRPDAPGAWLKLAEAQAELGQLDDALVAAEAGTRLDADVDFPHCAFGAVFARCGRAELARTHFLRSLEQDPEDSGGARQLLAALGFAPLPQRASSAQLLKLYAGRSEYWGGARGYRGHEAAISGLRQLWSGTRCIILDAGCGTGVAGPLLRPFAQRLDGVDLSPSMLARARDSAAYDTLHESELLEFLTSRPGDYDAVVSAATLIHFGELQPVFIAAARALRPWGIFVFTVFPNPANVDAVDVAPFGGLAEGGCFVHGSQYVRRTAQECGCSVAIEETVVHEIDQRGKPVHGKVFAIRRSG